MIIGNYETLKNTMIELYLSIISYQYNYCSIVNMKTIKIYWKK
jgi:hypothetical protein